MFLLCFYIILCVSPTIKVLLVAFGEEEHGFRCPARCLEQSLAVHILAHVADYSLVGLHHLVHLGGAVGLFGWC